MPLVILALYIPPLYSVQSERLTEWGREAETDRRRGEGGDADTAAWEEDNMMWRGGKWVGGGGGKGGVELSCRSYQVKPPTSGCHHGDTMVTTRCSTRKEHDLAYVKALPLCAASSLFLSRSESFSGMIRPKGACMLKHFFKNNQQM